MKISEIMNSDVDVKEAKPPKEYCKSTPPSEMSASWLSSCKSQGLVPRSGSMKHTIAGKRQKIRGKKLRGKKYGGVLPDWS